MNTRKIWILLLFICVTWSSTAQATNRWALVIGISNYQNSLANLLYPVNDAKAIADVLSKNQFFPREHVRVLLNEEATRQNITQAFSEWLPLYAAPGDLVLIYYSGHGIYSHDLPPLDEVDGRDEYLAPYDIDFSSFKRIAETGIRDDLIAEWLGNLPSDTVVIFDSCYSGGGIRSTVLPGKAKSLVPLLAQQTRSISEESGDMLGEFANIPEHINFMAASLPNQQSWEDTELEQSIFTYYFLQGLEGAADRNHDGDISVLEAFNFAKKGLASNQKWHALQEPILDLKKDVILLSQVLPEAQTAASDQAESLPRVNEGSSFKRQGKIKIELWFESIQADGSLKPVLKQQKLHSGDLLRLSFRTNQNCYLLVFNLDDSRHPRVVYPPNSQDQSLFVEKGQIYHARGSFTSQEGLERFYAVAIETPFSFSQDILPYFRRKSRSQDIPFSFAKIEFQHH